MNTLFYPYNRNLKIIEQEVNFFESGDVTVWTPTDAEKNVRLNFVAGIVDATYVRGTAATAAQSSIDTGNNSNTYTATLTHTSAAEGQSFRYAAATQPFVATGGAAIRIRKNVVGAGQATATRGRLNNVATLTTGSAHGFSVGDEIVVASVGGTGYNGKHIVTAINSSTSFSYENPGSNETLGTADTAGRVGNYVAIVRLIFV